MNSQSAPLPYGVSDIDLRVVEGYARKSRSFITREPNGGIVSPLARQSGRWLKWIGNDYTKGSEYHSEPEIQIRASGTYIYRDPLNNFIAGRPLIREALSGAWDKAETGRLGYENSEDALTWNVFRVLQEAQQLAALAGVIGIPPQASHPDLYLWGRRIGAVVTEPWPLLRQIRDRLEPGKGQQTEPDAVLHFPDWGWVFFEAKLGSQTSTYGSAPERIVEWINRYAHHCPGTFNPKSMAEIPGGEFPSQLLRNIAFAHQCCARGEKATVIALVRDRDQTPVEAWVDRCLMKSGSIQFARLTWEGLYRSLAAVAPGTERLRRYMSEKTVNLRPAFNFARERRAGTP